MMASSGTVPAIGDVVRIDHRAVPDLPDGADLLVKAVESARSIEGWVYLTVQVIGSADTSWKRRLTPVDRITIYPNGTS
jgi:hypothetical protein